MKEIIEANQAYGALTEGLYIASFTFDRAMVNVLDLLKGGLWMKVGPGFDDVNAFVRSLPLDRLKLLAEQRKEFAQRVKALQPAISNVAIADAMHVVEGTVRHALRNDYEAARLKPRPGAADGRRDASRINNRDTREERREEKLNSIAKAAELTGQFSVIYADPPWEDEFGPNDRQAELHYPVMALEALKALPVEAVSTPDAVLYLWALPHMLPTALELMTAWGFDYRTDLAWAKDKIGLGEWVRQQHESLLIGRRGEFPPPPPAVRSPSIVFAPRGEHSAKPEIFAEMIERWYPESAKIELFRRGPARSGWAAWGNQAEAAE